MNSIFEHLRAEPSIDLQSARVGVVGCGSVGSHVAWQLAACGVGSLILIDRDHLEPKNLRRHLATRQNVGQPKVEIVRQFIRDRFPTVRCDAQVFDVLDVPEQAEASLRDVELLIVAVDSESPKFLLHTIGCTHNFPVLYGGVYGAGWGIEAIHAPPPGPCYGCIARSLGRVGVPIDLPDTPSYAVPRTVASTDWIQAELTSVQVAAAMLSQLAVAILHARHGSPAPLAEWPGFAWRFPLRLTPAWANQPWQRLDIPITRQRDCLICGSETLP